MVISEKEFKPNLFALNTFILGAVLFFIPLFFLPNLNSSFDFAKNLIFRSSIIVSSLLTLYLFLSKKGFSIFKERFATPIFIYLMALFCVFFLSTIFSETPIQSFYGIYQRSQGFLQWIFYILFFILLCIYLNKKNIRLFATVILLSATISSSYGLLQKIGFDPFFKNFITDFFVGRIFSTLGNPDFLGQYLGIVLPIGVALIITAKKISVKILFSLACIICLLALFFTQSRAPILGIVSAGGIVLANLIIKRKIKIRHIVITLAAFSVIFVSAVFVPQIRSLPLINRFSVSQNNMRSVQTRLILWKNALQLIADRPFLGYGLDTFNIRYPKYADPKFFELEDNINTFPDRVHNEILEYGVNGGIPAIIIYLLLLSYVISLYFSRQSPYHREHELLEHAVFFSFFVLMFQNLVAFSELTHFVMFFFLLGSINVIQSRDLNKISFEVSGYKRPALIVASILIAVFSIYKSVIIPAKAEVLYSQSTKGTYEDGINKLQQALELNPYFSFYWYELLMKYPENMPMALYFIEQIEGETTHALAWKAVMLSSEDPTESYALFEKTIGINPRYPHAHRAYADALYRNGEYGRAVIEYEKYLELAPPFWKWKFDLDKKTDYQKKSYRIFFTKNVPDFNTVFEHIADAYKKTGQSEKAEYYRRFL